MGGGSHGRQVDKQTMHPREEALLPLLTDPGFAQLVQKMVQKERDKKLTLASLPA